MENSINEPPRKIKKHNWYSETDCGAFQVKLYKFFVEKKGLTVDQLKDCIKSYSEKYGFGKRCKKVKTQEGKELRSIVDEIEGGHRWAEAFFTHVAEKTGKMFKERPHYDYDDWFTASNLDGSFAYNGVTDDF